MTTGVTLRRVVELLLQHGAEIDLQDSDEWIALTWAAIEGHERVVGTARRSSCRTATAGPR